MTRRFAHVLLLGAVAGGLVAACGDDGGSGGSPTTTTDAGGTGGEPEPLAVTDLDDAAPGEAHVVLGSTFDVTLEVAQCRIDLAAEPDGQVPAELVSVRAEGELADGTPVLLDVKRFRSAGAATTITDTVTVIEGPETAPLRVLIAQRFEVGGQVTDGRDPDEREPLLRVGDTTVSATGIFAPPGAFAGDAGAVEGALSLTCP